MKAWLLQHMTNWLNQELDEPAGWPMCDFERLCFEIRPADVLLVEGRTRIGRVIQTVTRSIWTHSALYLGRVDDVSNPHSRELLLQYLPDECKHQPVVLEAVLGQGVIVTPLRAYEGYHLRICRPRGLAVGDIQQVISYAIARLGMGYDMRQMFDLARLMLPFALLPRRWHSSLFAHDAGSEVRTVCSTLIAEAFAAVQFPILPEFDGDPADMKIRPRNARLFTPRDFDYSPYFDIIKYPYLTSAEARPYQHMPWQPPDP